MTTSLRPRSDLWASELVLLSYLLCAHPALDDVKAYLLHFNAALLAGVWTMW